MTLVLIAGDVLLIGLVAAAAGHVWFLATGRS